MRPYRSVLTLRAILFVAQTHANRSGIGGSTFVEQRRQDLHRERVERQSTACEGKRGGNQEPKVDCQSFVV